VSAGSPKPGPGLNGPQPLDEQYRAQGLRVVQRFNALVRMGRAYQVENQVFRQQMVQFTETAGPVIEEAGELVLVVIDGDVYLNGVRIPVRPTTLKYHEALIEELDRRGIAGLRMEKGVTDEEIQTFFRLFMQPDVYYGTSLLEACLAHGSDHMLPAISASTHAEHAGDLRQPIPFGDEERPPAPGGESFGEADEAGESAWGGGSGGADRGAGGGVGGGPGHVPRGAAGKGYSMAVVGTRSLLTTTSVQSGMQVRHAKRVVQPLIDGAFADEPVVVGLSTLSHRDEYTYAHAVNVCIVATSMGHYLGMDRRALADLSVAALLHDVGKGPVAGRIQNPIGQWTDEERAAAVRHPFEGARLLARSTTLNQTTLRSLRVALEHHAHADGSGYPRLSAHHRVSLMARLVAIADCFVSLQTHRSRAGQMVTPYEALGRMLGPLHRKFDLALLWALVQTVGFYPPGQLVELDDRSIAVVLAPNRDDLARPHVRIVKEPHGLIPKPEEARELRPIPNDMQVRRPIPGAEYDRILEGTPPAGTEL
jgi:HD-GYP domain-containing protein (c-di-GMP phosphodiesterase class II)